MGRTVGVVLSAGALGATYQLAHEEGRGFINGMRQRALLRLARNEALTLLFTGSELPLELQTELLRARDIHKATVNMLLDPALTAPHHTILHMALVRLRGLQVVEEE